MWTQEQYTTLADAVSRGLLEVTYDGKKVVYQSLAEMRSLLAEMRAQMNPTTSPYGTVYVTFSRD